MHTASPDLGFTIIVVGGAVLALWGALLLGATRFARRRRREGKWDANGPLHPTDPPPGWEEVPGVGGHRPTIERDDGV
jgi:hypothetical protein